MTASFATSAPGTAASNPLPVAVVAEPLQLVKDHDIKREHSLTMPSARTYLDPVQCFVRANCIEVFTALKEDMTAPGRGLRPSRAGQVSLRGIQCKDAPHHERSVHQAMCFPLKLNTPELQVRPIGAVSARPQVGQGRVPQPEQAGRPPAQETPEDGQGTLCRGCH